MTRVLACGGRDFRMTDRAAAAFHEEVGRVAGTVLIHGAANGADKAAAALAIGRGMDVWPYPANWKVDGKAAGPIRNQRMIDVGKPDLVIAFPGGRGTEDMVRRAKAAGIEVREIEA